MCIRLRKELLSRFFKDRSDDALDTQLYMRKVSETSFRRYQLFAENVISARSTEVELIQSRL